MRHLYECPGNDVPSYGCFVKRETICPDCERRRHEVSSVILPVKCERCGVLKRNEDGRALYVALTWKRGKRIVCPDCREGEIMVDQLHDLVTRDDDYDEDMPF